MDAVGSSTSGEVTRLLQRAAAGDAGARDPLYRALYPELMRLAHGHLAGAGTLSMDASGLLHEAYLRLCAQPCLPDASRRVFYAYASKVMRSIVVDFVRERQAIKRGAGMRDVTLDTDLAESIFAENSASEVEGALAALEVLDARASQVVDLRYFGGMSEEEIAAVLEVSVATVRRDWRKARAFLFEQLG
ncbi:MAG: sigma-70 family RNA polymerase sigma factor [Proteobacteria bacterium]|nr:sigma-70 family RNA polymerase sigma factor [Pseudomonadota bacterium]